MRSRTQILQQEYGVNTASEARKLIMSVDFKRPPPPLSEWVKTTFPYEAPEHPSLPSVAEIQQRVRDSRARRPDRPFPGRFGECFVKFCNNPIILQEAENLLFLQKHSRVRTPTVYAAFSDDSGPYTMYYMITEFIEGRTFHSDDWIALGAETQKYLCSKIAEQLQLLRSIPSEGYYGRLYHQGYAPFASLFRMRCEEMCGPYETYEDLVSAIYSGMEMRGAILNGITDFYPDEEDVFRIMKPTLLGFRQEPKLTHLDFKFDNMIFRPIQGPNGEVADWEVVIIDWACLGWYPVWMQGIAAAFRCFIFDKGVQQNFLQWLSEYMGEPRGEEEEFFLEVVASWLATPIEYFGISQ